MSILLIVVQKNGIEKQRPSGAGPKQGRNTEVGRSVLPYNVDRFARD